MANYELSVSFDYVPDWTFVEAVREIFQNALDQQTSSEDNKMYYEYREEEKKLLIGNANSTLSKKTLLIGSSGKRNEDNTIGQHGEGYKIATVVLLREGLGLKVYNYLEKEIWTAKKINSRRYGTEIPAFVVEKCVPFIRPVENQNLIFEITGVTQEMFDAIVDSNLVLQEDIGNIGETMDSNTGRVLLDKEYAGKIYVSGLYICTESRLKKGYDFKPNAISLDRDRKTISGSVLQSACSNLIAGTENPELIRSMIDTYDGYFLESRYSSAMAAAGEILAKEFYEEYGNNAVPVSNQKEYDEAKKYGANPKIVSYSYLSIIKRSELFAERNEAYAANVISLEDQFKDWYEKARVYLPQELQEEGDELVERIVDEL